MAASTSLKDGSSSSLSLLYWPASNSPSQQQSSPLSSEVLLFKLLNHQLMEPLIHPQESREGATFTLPHLLQLTVLFSLHDQPPRADYISPFPAKETQLHRPRRNPPTISGHQRKDRMPKHEKSYMRSLTSALVHTQILMLYYVFMSCLLFGLNSGGFRPDVAR